MLLKNFMLSKVACTVVLVFLAFLSLSKKCVGSSVPGRDRLTSKFYELRSFASFMCVVCTGHV